MTDGAGTGFVCDRCSTCCRRHRVPLTRDDIANLLLPAAELGIDLEAFVECADARDIDMEGEPESFFLLREGRKMLFLSHREGEKGSACVFLSPSGCGVHQHRPTSCRAYPYEQPRPGSRSLTLHPDMMCPPETGVHTTAKRNPEKDDLGAAYYAFLRTRDAQSSEHASFVGRWNQRQKMRLKLRRLPEGREELFRLLKRQACGVARPSTAPE